MTVLTYEMARGLPEHLAAAAVPESFRDENGHMNVRYHFDLAATAIRGFMDWAGIDAGYSAARHCGFFTVEQHIRFNSEVEIGDVVRSTVVAIASAPKTVHGMALLLNETTATIATTVEFVAVHVDLDSRSAVPFPEDVSQRLGEVCESDSDVLSLLPLCGAMGVSRRPSAKVGSTE